jgi:hypothetical protein
MIAANPQLQPRNVSRSKASCGMSVGRAVVEAGVESWFMPAVF